MVMTGLSCRDHRLRRRTKFGSEIQSKTESSCCIDPALPVSSVDAHSKDQSDELDKWFNPFILEYSVLALLLVLFGFVVIFFFFALLTHACAIYISLTHVREPFAPPAPPASSLPSASVGFHWYLYHLSAFASGEHIFSVRREGIASQ